MQSKVLSHGLYHHHHQNPCLFALQPFINNVEHQDEEILLFTPPPKDQKVPILSSNVEVEPKGRKSQGSALSLDKLRWWSWYVADGVSCGPRRDPAEETHLLSYLIESVGFNQLRPDWTNKQQIESLSGQDHNHWPRSFKREVLHTQMQTYQSINVLLSEHLLHISTIHQPYANYIWHMCLPPPPSPTTYATS